MNHNTSAGSPRRRPPARRRPTRPAGVSQATSPLSPSLAPSRPLSLSLARSLEAAGGPAVPSRYLEAPARPTSLRGPPVPHAAALPLPAPAPRPGPRRPTRTELGRDGATALPPNKQVAGAGHKRALSAAERGVTGGASLRTAPAGDKRSKRGRRQQQPAPQGGKHIKLASGARARGAARAPRAARRAAPTNPRVWGTAALTPPPRSGPPRPARRRAAPRPAARAAQRMMAAGAPTQADAARRGRGAAVPCTLSPSRHAAPPAARPARTGRGRLTPPTRSTALHPCLPRGRARRQGARARGAHCTRGARPPGRRRGRGRGPQCRAAPRRRLGEPLWRRRVRFSKIASPSAPALDPRLNPP